ncbi:MAG: FAD-dependent oxidoreductase [Hyphomicrobiales bacterium]|nr:FAD-dependent oxidoreductase [Hyphomicrobiales bacterium]
MSFPTSVDFAILGAGAAGIAAGRSFAAARRSFIMLEARSRIGGRAHTVTGLAPVPLDLGCEWLHSADRNVLTGLARRMGFVVEETHPRWGSLRMSHVDEKERRAFRKAATAFWETVDEAAQNGAGDAPAANWLTPGGRWNPLIEAISTYSNGAPLGRVSIIDMHRYDDSYVNWKIAEGYGALIAAAGAGLPVALDCAVSAIDHSGALLRIETERGTVQAKGCIVTAPTNILARGAIRFTPPLPDKIEAAANLPLGMANKIFFRVEGRSELPKSAHMFGALDRMEALSFDLRPGGKPIVEGYAGGDFARALERDGAAAFEAEARRQIADQFGAHGLRGLRAVITTAWDGDPFARGAYSHALPGHADARARLAAPVGERLFFAGEATHASRFSTCHGAWESGASAAAAALAAVAA